MQADPGRREQANAYVQSTLDNSVKVIEFTLIIVYFFAGPHPTLLIWFNIRKYTINVDTYQNFIL